MIDLKKALIPYPKKVFAGEKAVKIAAKYLPKKSNVKTTKDEFVTDYLNELLIALRTSSPSAKLDEYVNILHKYIPTCLGKAISFDL